VKRNYTFWLVVAIAIIVAACAYALFFVSYINAD